MAEGTSHVHAHGDQNDHQQEMIKNIMKDISLESPATEPVRANAPSTPLTIASYMPHGSESSWPTTISLVSAPTVSAPMDAPAVSGTPTAQGRSVPRPLSADIIAEGVPAPPAQRSATPTAQGTSGFTADSPAAGTQIVLLPGTNIPAHMQEALNSPQKSQSNPESMRGNNSPHSVGHSPSVGNGGMNQSLGHHGMDGHQHILLQATDDSLHHHPDQLQHHYLMQQQQQLLHCDVPDQMQGFFPVWDNNQLVGYVRMPPGGGADHHMQEAYMQQGQLEMMYGDYNGGYGMYGKGRKGGRGIGGNRGDLHRHKVTLWEMSDLKERVVEFSRDQDGSRFIQKKLTAGCTDEEKEMLFSEVQPRMLELMTDVFGNYVVQKLLEHGLPHHVQRLAEGFRGHVLSLSLQTYGCRVVQKALDVMVNDKEFKEMVARELDGHVPRCVQDQNGNHVIQKCIETMPDSVSFIVNAFRGNVHHLATHAYGCRVIQRLLEHCKLSSQIEPILEEILSNAAMLVKDQYGNYVVQDLLTYGQPRHQVAVGDRLRGQLMELSKHKFASNVVEKLFMCGDTEERSKFLGELMNTMTPDGCSAMLNMVKDQFANYVVQKILDLADGQQRMAIVEHIRPHAMMLRKYPYGKHIISRIERLSGQPLPRSYDDMPSQSRSHLSNQNVVHMQYHQQPRDAQHGGAPVYVQQQYQQHMPQQAQYSRN